MSMPSVRGAGPVGAVYLRCYPFDLWGMASHRAAVRAHAQSLGFWDLHVFLDNGRRSGTPLPRLGELFAWVASGRCDVVFVPGPWVFSIDDEAARSTVRRLCRLGGRVEETPDPRRAVRDPVPIRSGTGSGR